VIRTVLRRVLPQLDVIDQDPVDAAVLAAFMYPYIEQAAEVCAEEAERFLIEGFELSPFHPARLQAALEATEVRACFLGHACFSTDDLAGYRGPKPQHPGHPMQNWTRPPPGFDGGASICASSVTMPQCRTSTSGRSASRAR
jgi:hypothetical protein